MGRSQAVPRERDDRFGPDADDTGCRFLHVDMDAFFAAVEIRRHPELAGRPVVVGGTGPRGVVGSASYPARRYGVRSAMPTSRARALCPDAVFLPTDLAEYREASRTVMAILREITPLVEPISLDEAFLDVAGARRRLGPPARVAAMVRRRVCDELGLTCSVGVASTKFVAKLGSARVKPDGLLVVPAARAEEFLHPLPVESLWGVGERAADALRRLGLGTVGDLAAAPVAALRAAVGAAAAEHLHALAWGRDPRRVEPDQAEQSISAETTFDTDVADRAGIRRTLLALSGRVAERLRAGDRVGRTVTIKIRFADFRTVQRSRTVHAPTDVARDIFHAAWSLYEALSPGEPIRLVGVRIGNLLSGGTAPHQPALGARERGWREAEVAGDAVAARFGAAALSPASLLSPDDHANRTSSRHVPLSERPPPS